MAANKIIIAGADVKDALDAERASLPKNGSGNTLSEPLCKMQISQARRGYVAAQLVESIYGWSVRYDSGLQNFSLIASSRQKQVDGSLDDAVRYAKEWVDRDPSRRYAYYYGA